MTLKLNQKVIEKAQEYAFNNKKGRHCPDNSATRRG